MKIAVTGSIGSGKSVVCEYLRQKGFDVFDCDYENSLLLQKGEKGYLMIREEFPDCFDGDELNKKKLAAIIFNDEESKKKLEDICHPLILGRLMARSDDPLFAEVPLLFETGWDAYFDHNLLVVTDTDILIPRLVERGMEYEDIMERLDSQMSIAEKIKRADKIIYNNGSLQDLYQLIDEWLCELQC
ncbi:MAG: dephospho-CoA kinase [Erysipelotrichaceae bacterium]|nr:dephospho-CoA kinase [Erysipelotrichaceae bacterium]